MKILMIGDVVGDPGRLVINTVLPELRERLQVQFVVANAENADRSGNGICAKAVKDVFRSGAVDVVTLGDHAYKKRDVYGELTKRPTGL